MGAEGPELLGAPTPSQRLCQLRSFIHSSWLMTLWDALGFMTFKTSGWLLTPLVEMIGHEFIKENFQGTEPSGQGSRELTLFQQGSGLTQWGREIKPSSGYNRTAGEGFIANRRAKGSLNKKKLPWGPWLDIVRGESPYTGLARFLLKLKLGRGGVLITVQRNLEACGKKEQVIGRHFSNVLCLA